MLPPKTVFPNNYDSDFTLYKVYDTAETVLKSDNLAWSEEIEIEPVAADKNEIWADNGYANISGELFYYDSVEKNANGKIYKFKNCSRNLGGERTRNNKAGTEVRGFVIAQHHNQLAYASINLQKYIGIDNSTDKKSLDWKINRLATTPNLLDDFTTPNVTFDFKILENDPFQGILTSYLLTIDGTYDSTIIDFGDGTTTTDLGPGQHRYPPNVFPDPFAVIRNEKSEVVISPEIRPFTDSVNFASAPDIISLFEEPDPFDIPLPEIPVIPTFTIPTIPTPSNIINTPPIVFPCLNVNTSGFSFPNISFPSINIPTINIPSSINLVPSVLGISVLDVNVSLSISPPIPSIISISPGIPSIIQISQIGPLVPSIISWVSNPVIPSIISFANPPVFSVISVQGNFTVSLSIPDSWPVISFATLVIPPISFNDPPTLSCVVTIQCPSGGGAFTNRRPQTPLYDFPEDQLESLSLDGLDFGLPSEIFVRIPEISDIQIIHDIPAIIRVETPKIPNIKIDVPNFNIPEEIKLNYEGLPSSIELVANSLPKSISLDTSGLPKSIPLEVPKEFPKIKIDASDIPDKIQVVGIPSTIELVGAPSEIKLVLPEKPEIELVYRGAPIDVKVNLDIGRLTGDSENAQCVAIVPCVNK